MIKQMPFMEPPAWLMNVSKNTINTAPFPLREVLQDSLYYPGAGSDGKPVKWFAGNVYSFVYTDYGVSRDELLNDLNGEKGFNGYHVLTQRDLTMNELIPNGWQPMYSGVPPRRASGWRTKKIEPFGIWVIMERSENLPPEHGPERFSLLYLGSEGVAAYQALYNSNQIEPKIFFLIHHCFGGNWTNFERSYDILAVSVRANTAGMPDYLVGRYSRRIRRSIQGDSYWPNDYSAPTLEYIGGGCGLNYGLWQHNSGKQLN